MVGSNIYCSKIGSATPHREVTAHALLTVKGWVLASHWMPKLAGRWADRRTDGWTDRETDKQKDRLISRETICLTVRVPCAVSLFLLGMCVCGHAGCAWFVCFVQCVCVCTCVCVCVWRAADIGCPWGGQLSLLYTRQALLTACPSASKLPSPGWSWGQAPYWHLGSQEQADTSHILYSHTQKETHTLTKTQRRKGTDTHTQITHSKRARERDLHRKRVRHSHILTLPKTLRENVHSHNETYTQY